MPNKVELHEEANTLRDKLRYALDALVKIQTMPAPGPRRRLAEDTIAKINNWGVGNICGCGDFDKEFCDKCKVCIDCCECHWEE